MLCWVKWACIHVRVTGFGMALIFYSVTCDGVSLIFIHLGGGRTAVWADASCRLALSSAVHICTYLVFILVIRGAFKL